MQKNEALGFIMATLLGLVGCVLWGVLYYFEVIAGLAAYLIIFLAGVGYKKFGKIAFLEKKHYVIMVVISLVELALTFLICYFDHRIPQYGVFIHIALNKFLGHNA